MSDHDDLARLAADAYVYGYPLVFDVSMVRRCLRTGFGSLPATSANAFAHARKLAGPQDDFVSVNNDTIYSLAQLDLSGGPLLLRVPDTADAYYVLQFVDTWTNNFAYVGRRATGTDAAAFVVAPPGWIGAVPDGTRVIAAPTTVASIVGRFACAGPDDLGRVAKLQEQLTLEPLGDPGPTRGLPEPDATVPEDMRFWEELRVLLAAFPPDTEDAEYQRRYAALGLLHEGESPYHDAPDDLVTALRKGYASGRQRVEEASRTGLDDRSSTWHMALHLFDYNVDRLGLGTIDAPDWRIGDRRASYLVRAVAARVGLWGNHAYEAVYATTYTDAEGRQLNGSRNYTLTFPSPPPVDAFWSVTMYDMPDYFLIDNAANRYSIGDRTPGLVYGSDGSLTLYLMHAKPVEGEAANWLPTPAGDFRPMLRMYQPGKAVLDGTYQLPDIQALD
ncbi:DUF1254 domain-containing protein [Streptomycetaceae bacterium NBC_01309]